MAGYLSEVTQPPPFSARSDEYHVETLRDRLPQRWKSGGRDSVESIVGILSETRDHHLYRKVGARSWADYCSAFLSSPAQAMDELIEGVRILKGQSPARRQISEDEARSAAVERARVQAETISPKGGRPSSGKTHDGVMRSPEQGNSSTYLLRRIARSSPETLAAYEAGRFATVRQAARAAGIPDSPKRVALGDPKRVADQIVELGDEYAVTVLLALADRLKFKL